MLASCRTTERRVDAGEVRDHRQEPVPERERVARVQAAVGELVDRAQREPVEGIELANAREMEERVAGEGRRDPPERDPEQDAAAEQEQRPGARLELPAAERERQRDDPDRGQRDEPERDRRAEREHHRHRERDGRECERQRRRDPAQQQCPRDEEAGQQHAGGREDQPQPKPEPGLRQEPRDQQAGHDEQRHERGDPHRRPRPRPRVRAPSSTDSARSITPPRLPARPPTRSRASVPRRGTSARVPRGRSRRGGAATRAAAAVSARPCARRGASS